MSSTFKNPSIKADRIIPDFFELESPELSQFLKFYFEWLESNGANDFENRRILEYSDIDYRKDNYKQFDAFLRNEFLSAIPNNLKVDERLLIKNIRDFYKAKGSEESIRILFKILFNEDVEVYFPGQYILRASDGKWSIEESLRITLLEDAALNVTESLDYVIGQDSKAAAKIDRVNQYLENGVNVTEIFIHSKTGEFQVGELLSLKSTGEFFGTILEDGIIKYPGRFINTDGFLSSDKKLQDNYFYQEFSYVIRSSIPYNYYADTVKSTVHPAGTLLFSEIFFQIELENAPMRDFVDIVHTKVVEYPIDLFQYISLVVEGSSEKIGSTNSRYIFEYDFLIFDSPNVSINPETGTPYEDFRFDSVITKYNKIYMNNAKIGDFNSFDERKNVRMTTAGSIEIRDVQYKKFVETSSPNAKSAMPNSIMHIKNNINNKEHYNFVKTIHSDTLFSMREEFKDGNTNSANITVFNS